MITFTLCLLALIAGYFIYGRFIERVFGPDDRKTPAPVSYTHLDVYKRQIQVNGNQTNLFAIGNEVVDSFAGSFRYRTHGDDNAFCICLLYTSRCV